MFQKGFDISFAVSVTSARKYYGHLHLCNQSHLKYNSFLGQRNHRDLCCLTIPIHGLFTPSAPFASDGTGTLAGAGPSGASGFPRCPGSLLLRISALTPALMVAPVPPLSPPRLDSSALRASSPITPGPTDVGSGCSPPLPSSDHSTFPAFPHLHTLSSSVNSQCQ